ncbi:DUF6196 family protein [Erythrobacter sp.]|uniref:DUF6196 family protein n=1 Tax=Erythrobacter sp. TaxID=1042 RepID=UPI00311FEFD8
MVSVSYETAVETDLRLRRVIADARLTLFDRPYEFIETSISAPFTMPSDCLASVRDNDVWSFLVPAGPNSREPFTIWCFHFEEGQDNSGFVGWLASTIKSALGTGVFVTCGQNSSVGGIFDYWGCPESMGPAVLALIRDLRKK